MPELPHWLMIAGAILVMVGGVGFAFNRKKEVETDSVLLPGDLASWKAQQPPLSPGPRKRKK
jgi:hypothetical protein